MKKPLSVLAVLLSLVVATTCLCGSVRAAGINEFNPWVAAQLPVENVPRGQDAEVLKTIGGSILNIQTEARHRPHWKNEVYPILQGTLEAPHEVLVCIDFAKPASRAVWAAATDAMKRTNPSRARFVLFCSGAELYGTDLAGLAIWATMNRQGQAADYLSWALRRWDEVKAAQKRAGRVHRFNHEYDAVATTHDLPMVFQGMDRFRPAVPESQQHDVSAYAYEAGNINRFQAQTVEKRHRVTLPCLVVDGRVLPAAEAGRLKDLLK